MALNLGEKQDMTIFENVVPPPPLGTTFGTHIQTDMITLSVWSRPFRTTRLKLLKLKWPKNDPG